MNGNKTIDCGSGTRFRYWSITQEAQNGGNPCRNKRAESEKCNKEKACPDGENFFETRINKLTSKSKSFQH